MSVDWATLRALAGMADEVGVLSIYASLDPQRRTEPTSKPAWEVQVRRELAQVTERLKQDGPREHWKALTERLQALQVPLDDLFDPAASGQGRAMFVGVASGDSSTVTTQVPLVDGATLDRRPRLRPLVAAWTAARPAGAVTVDRDQVRAVDVRFGLAENIASFPYQGSVEQRELKGPAGGNPAMAQQTAPQHDLYERREEEKLIRFLRTLGPRLAELAKERDWHDLVVTGEASLAHAVTEGLAVKGLEVTVLEHPVGSMTAPQVAELVAPTLAEARRRGNADLVARVRDAAFGGTGGAYGVSDTLAALAQGQVAHLLLAADGHWSGRVAPDGTLAAGTEVPPGADAAALTPVADLGERMLELAFGQSAEISVLAPEQAEGLADADGVAALLRW